MTVDQGYSVDRYAYSGPGDYDFHFYLTDDDYLRVTYQDENGLVTVLAKGTDYTVVINEDPTTGGVLTAINPSAIVGTLEIRRLLSLVQLREWSIEGYLNLDKLELSQDEIVMMIQQIDYAASAAAAATNWRGVWQTATAYAVKDMVTAPNNNLYICDLAHTSTTDFATDLAAGNWKVIIDVTYIEELKAACEAYASSASDSASAAYASQVAALASSVLAKASEDAAALSEGNSAVNAQNSANCNQEAYDNAQDAIAAKIICEEIAATIDLPTPVSGDENKALVVDSVDPTVWKLGGSSQVDSIQGTTDEIDVDSADPRNPIVSISSDFVGRPIPRISGALVTGGIHGGGVKSHTNTTVTMNPFSCRSDDVTARSMSKNSDTVVDLGTPAINTVYHLFMVRYTGGTFGYEFDTNIDGSGLTGISHKRWDSFVRTNASGNLMVCVQEWDYLHFLIATEAIFASGVSVGTGSYTQVDMSSFLPLSRIAEASYGIRDDGTGIVPVNISSDGTYSAVPLSTPRASDTPTDDTGVHCWGYYTTAQHSYIPVIGNGPWLKANSAITLTGVMVQAMKLRR